MDYKKLFNGCNRGVAKMMFQNKLAVSYRIESVRTTSAPISYICCYIFGGAPSGCRASHGKFLRTRKEALRELNTCATFI